MHIILGLLGTIITILILLNRLADAGIDLGGLNPYLWNRRRKWRNKYEGNPIFKIESPMDATAILMVVMAKADGDMAREDKSLLLRIFETEFKLSKKDAAGLLISSSHLLGNGAEVKNDIKGFLAPSLAAFSDVQAKSASLLIRQVANNGNSELHKNLMQRIEQALLPKEEDESTW